MNQVLSPPNPIFLWLQKVTAFVKRDFVIERSYKMAFVLKLMNSFFPIISFFFLSKLIDGSSLEVIKKYGGSYFSFALIGVSFTRFFQLAVDTFSDSMKRAQMAGCLEAILSSQTSARSVVLMSSLYSFISAGMQLILMFLAGTFFFGFSWSNINLPSAILALFLSLIAFISLGILSAAGTVIFKQGEPFGWIFGALSGLLGGAFFPVEVMPEWLQWISRIFPISYSLDALRLSVLKGHTINMLSNHMLILTGMAIILFPLSLRFFVWAVEKGKRDGTLMQY